MKRISCIVLVITALILSVLLVSCSMKGKNVPESKSSSASEASQPVSTSKPVSSQKTQSKLQSSAVSSTANASAMNSTGNSNDWLLRLVNKQNQLTKDVDIKFGYITKDITVDDRILADLKAMIEAAKEDGIKLSIVSGYRSIARQTSIFNNNVTAAMNQHGISKEEAIDMVDDYSAPPKASEHSLGLSVDVVNVGWFNDNDKLYDTFDQTEAFKWLNQNADKYGFIMRYAKNKESITGYAYEPWHFRYVGKHYAPIIKASGKCLEEYLGVA